MSTASIKVQPSSTPADPDVATHRVAGSDYQVVKLAVGDENTARLVTDANGVPVTGTFFPATQPVSIAAAVAVTGPVTNTELRATPIAISVASQPLPTGASTEATLAAVNAKIPASPATDRTTAAAPFAMRLSDGGAFIAPALESGNLATLTARTPALGAALPANSSPVTLPNDVVVTGGSIASPALNQELLTNTANGWYDAANLHSASLQIQTGVGITAGVLTFEQTNDITASPAGNVLQVMDATVINANPVTTLTLAANTSRMFVLPVTSRYIRVRVTTAVLGGSVQALLAGSQLPLAALTHNVQQATAGNLQVTVSGTVTANIGTGSQAAGTNAIGDVGIQLRANATGAASGAHIVSAATTNATIVKAAAGRVTGWSLANITATWRYVKLHNIATAPTAGAAVVRTIGIPPNGRAEAFSAAGIAFTTGIGLTIVAGAADADATAVAVNDVVGDIFFA